DDPGEGDEEPPVVINDRAPAATGVEVLWRRGRGLPQSPLPTKFQRLRAIDAVSKTALPVSAFSGSYKVRLPQFDFMALLVVTPPPSPIPRPRLRPREPGYRSRTNPQPWRCAPPHFDRYRRGDGEHARYVRAVRSPADRAADEGG